MRALVIAALLALPLAAAGAPLPFPDADMEAAGTEAWKAYGTPARLEKVGQAHAGQQALRVATDNKEVMGGGFEGVSRSLGELTQGDRVRVSFWMRPLAGKEVWIGIGRTSFDQIWRPFDTDWMQVVCDFRVRASGHHNIWITQQGTANDFLLDDFAVERIPRPALGTAPAGERVSLGGAAGRLSFCRRTGALCGISGPAAPESFLPLPDRQPLFALRVLGPDGRGIEEMGFDQAALESLREDAGRLTLVFALKPHPIRVTCRVARTAAGEFTFAGTVENRSDRTILEFAYPLLQGVRPALDSKALTLVHPYLCGQIVPNALRSEGCDSVYPGRAVMGWLDLSGEEGGLSLATHDPRAPAPASPRSLPSGIRSTSASPRKWRSAPARRGRRRSTSSCSTAATGMPRPITTAPGRASGWGHRTFRRGSAMPTGGCSWASRTASPSGAFPMSTAPPSGWA